MNFKKLHYQEECLIIGNVWDPLSAILMEEAGFKAIGTTSWGIANTLGYKDGENIKFEDQFDIINKIKKHTNIPLTVDIEAGYSNKPEQILENILKLVNIGCAGINIEDSLPSKGLRNENDFAKLLSFIKTNLENYGHSDFFINVRIDTYLNNINQVFEKTKQRAILYEKSGADGIFIPGLVSISEIKKILNEISLPLNILSLPNATNIEIFEKLGVKRFSFGNAMSDYIISQIETLSTQILKKKNTDCLYFDKKIKYPFKSI